MAELAEFYERKAIRPLLSRCFPLSEAAAAIEWIGSRQAVGKAVIQMT